MEETKNSFHYQPLDESRREIRLVLLTPALNLLDDVHCTLQKTSLLDSPDYEAVSYVWGEPNVTEQIFVEGQSFQATTNLVLALRYLRHKSESKLLWVDAICIDQKDLQERGKQVGFMGQIYAEATRDLVFIGPDSFPDTTRNITASFEGVDIDGDSFDPATTDPVQLPPKIAALVKKKWEHLVDWGNAVFEASVWHRLWIVQEISKAKEVRFILGGTNLHWRHITFIANYVYGTFRVPWSFSNAKALLGVSTLFLLIGQRLDSSDGETQLLDLWDSFNHCFCSDPRDKMYALISLARFDGPTSALVTDYTMEPDILYTKFSREEILRRRDLRVIHYHSASRDDLSDRAKALTANPSLEALNSKLPSWVPNFSNMLCQRPSMIKELLGTDTRWTSMPLLSDHQLQKIKNENASKSLTVFGLRLDTVRVNFPPSHGASVQMAREAYIANELLLSSACVYGKPQVYETYWNTICCGMRSVYKDIFIDRKRLCQKSDPEAYSAWLSQIPKRRKPADYRKNISRKTLKKKSDHLDRTLFMQQVKDMSQNHSFALTAKGHFAMVPDDSKPGDIICALYGGEVPLVLRPVEGTEGEGARWNLVGIAYLHGFMDLVPIEMRDKGLLKDEEFELV